LSPNAQTLPGGRGESGVQGYNTNPGYSSGYYNQGYYNPGYGYYNSGYYNPGYYNSGSYGTGYYNQGAYNPGYYNSGSYSTGYYNPGSYYSNMNSGYNNMPAYSENGSMMANQSNSNFQSGTSGYYSPSDSMNNRSILVQLHVPADAQVWFDGNATQQQGEWRDYISPPVDTDKPLQYEVRVSWTDANGQKVDKTQAIKVRAGHRSVLDLMRETSSSSQDQQNNRETPRPTPGTSEQQENREPLRGRTEQTDRSDATKATAGKVTLNIRNESDKPVFVVLDANRDANREGDEVELGSGKKIRGFLIEPKGMKTFHPSTDDKPTFHFWEVQDGKPVKELSSKSIQEGLDRSETASAQTLNYEWKDNDLKQKR